MILMVLLLTALQQVDDNIIHIDMKLLDREAEAEPS